MFVRHLKPRHGFERVLLVSGDRETEVRYLAHAKQMQALGLIPALAPLLGEVGLHRLEEVLLERL